MVANGLCTINLHYVEQGMCLTGSPMDNITVLYKFIFKDIDFNECFSLRDRTFRACLFQNCVFGMGVSFVGTHFEFCLFECCKFVKADFGFSVVDFCHFNKCHITDCKFYPAAVSDTVFDSTKILRARVFDEPYPFRNCYQNNFLQLEAPFNRLSTSVSDNRIRKISRLKLKALEDSTSFTKSQSRSIICYR